VLENPPPGAELRILIEYWPYVPGIDTLSWVGELIVAGTESPLIRTRELLTNPEPVMVNVSPATVVVGEAEAMLGTGFWIVSR
jgi:hypothetical protein